MGFRSFGRANESYDTHDRAGRAGRPHRGELPPPRPGGQFAQHPNLRSRPRQPGAGRRRDAVAHRARRGAQREVDQGHSARHRPQATHQSAAAPHAQRQHLHRNPRSRGPRARPAHDQGHGEVPDATASAARGEHDLVLVGAGDRHRDREPLRRHRPGQVLAPVPERQLHGARRRHRHRPTCELRPGLDAGQRERCGNRPHRVEP